MRPSPNIATTISTTPPRRRRYAHSSRSPARPDWKRPGTPTLGVQVQVLLRQLGLAGRRVNWDHRPPVSERKFDTQAWDTIPRAQDPAHIEAIDADTHDRRTNGPGGEKRI